MEARRANSRYSHRNVSLAGKAASETDIGIVIVDHHNVCVKVPPCP